MKTFANSDFSGPAESPGFLLWQVSNSWQREQRQAVKEFGLSHAQFVLLAGLAWMTKKQAAVNQSDLAEFVRMDRMMVSEVSRTLEKKRLLIRSKHPSDSRAFALSITGKGAELVSMGIPAVEAVDRRFFSLSTSELRTLSNLLARLSARNSKKGGEYVER